MSEKRFRVRFEQEDGRGEIVNEKGVELTASELVELLNNLHQEVIAQKSLANYYRQKYKECEKFVDENVKGEVVIKR